MQHLQQQSESDHASIHTDEPGLADATAMKRLAEGSGLDSNSEYSYLMVCQFFSSTSVVARQDDEIVGFISGFAVPGSENEVFVWQIAVSPQHRGLGIASQMLDALITRRSNAPDAGFNYLQATISPSNSASVKTFTSLAGRLNCEIGSKPLFSQDHFSSSDHEEEVLYRIGPFDAAGFATQSSSN